MNNMEQFASTAEKSDSKEVVKKIAELHFGQLDEIERMPTGICNEVFVIKHDGVSYIVRMNTDTTEMRGSSLFIPKLKALGIRVPDIIAEEYDVTKIGFGYQILERLSGTDLGNVIEHLSEQQLKKIATEVARIFIKTRDIETDGTFGFVTDETGGEFVLWQEWVDDTFETAERRAEETGLIQQVKHLVEPVRSILDKHKPYFENVSSVAYYDDIAGKNVLVDDGKFSGLVDLDSLAYGDFLEAVGRIKTSWYGTEYGKIYTNAVMDELDLTNQQREIVHVYALLHRFAWMCENGVVFNQNTTGVIDEEKLKRDLGTVASLLKDID